MAVKFTTAADVARSPAFDPDTPAPPRYNPGPPFDALDVRPGRVVLIGAPPGAGKTALTMQLVAGVLQHHPDLRAVVGNVEMSPADLLAKVVARLAGVPVGNVTDKTYGPGEKKRVKQALALHAGLLGRLAFLDPPFTAEHLADALDDFEATVVVADYVQRFAVGKDQREALDGLMTALRRLALAGAAVVAVSSVSRQKDDKGRSAYAGLNLASFRGSAELKFGADSAYLVDAANGVAVLRCVKHRYGKPADVQLRFDGEYQRYERGDPLDGFDAAPGRTQAKGKSR
ncbi:MAG: dnaB [Gemmataceae bacterium]|nr:dnaB [Gemmataceae bacterium]